MRRRNNFRRALGIVGLIMIVAYAVTIGFSGSLVLDGAAQAQQGAVPGESLGATSDSEFWRALRKGEVGGVSIPDKMAGILIQSEGENWRAIRNGPLSTYGGWAMLGIVILLALYFALRGRIKIEAGPSANRIERFNGIERFAHWLMASTFIVLGLSGLNMLYGRYVLLPVLGPDAFATLSLWGKFAHIYLAFGFMLGVALSFLLWAGQNFPNKHDLIWLAKLGGLFSKHSHPPAKKFNAGQKILFWVVILGGVSISLSGIALMFPFETKMFDATFKVLNGIGFNLPAEVTAMQEQQLSQLWHGIVGLVLIVIIIAHIYIGTMGMEGAFDAMGSGEVDENWAREHHSVWVAENQGGSAAGEGGESGAKSEAKGEGGKAAQGA